MKCCIVGLTVVGCCFSALAGVEWRNLDDAHKAGGRKATTGYLQGKVVLVCKDSALMSRMETIWQSFKTKEFVLLGACGAADGCTFPMYRDAGLSANEPEAPLYVVDETGKAVYTGKDDRMATQSLVIALTDKDSPKSVKQWMTFLDYELKELPGHAFVRYSDFKKAYPKEAKAYLEKMKPLTQIKDIKKVGELLVFAKKAKDTPLFDAKKKMQKAKFLKTLDSTLSRYSALKDSADERVAQEVKNALADIKWTKAAHE